MENTSIALVVLAAGMGSRYGGLKQMDELGPNGETILDYSVYDAIRAGFDKVVFVIRDFFAEEFKKKISQNFNDRIEVHYVFQHVNPELDFVERKLHREKPWGTNHAVLVAREAVNEPFAVINADDYYGRDGFEKMATFLKTEVSEHEYAMVGYPIQNTLSDSGSVNRGVCEEQEGYLVNIVETLKISKQADGTLLSAPGGGDPVSVSPKATVSMNFWGFHQNYFEHLEQGFKEFVLNHLDNPKAEYYIPSLVDELIRSGQAKVRVLSSEENWYGVTYKEDADFVKTAFARFEKESKYPNPLWS